MRVSLLTVGDEVLIGHTLDTNAQYLGLFFSDAGHDVVAHETVPDEREAMRRAIVRLRDESDLVVVTGGLGGTPDDITLDVVAELLGRAISPSRELLDAFVEKFQPPGGRLPPATLRIARAIEGADLLVNPVGQAPGVFVDEADGALLLLPGVPAEMRAILEAAASRFVAGARPVTYRVMLASESVLAEALEKRGVSGVAFLPGAGWVDLRLRSDTPESTLAIVGEVCGDALIGDDRTVVEEVVGDALRTAGQTVALAESLSGGAVGARLTRVAGASDYFLGGVAAYANEVKREVLGVSEETLTGFGAVSGETAREMAAGVKRLVGSDWAVSTTGIAGPTGAVPGKPLGTVHVGLASPDGKLISRHRRFPGPRPAVIARSVSFALDTLRRALQGRTLPGEAS